MILSHILKSVEKQLRSQFVIEMMKIDTQAFCNILLSGKLARIAKLLIKCYFGYEKLSQGNQKKGVTSQIRRISKRQKKQSFSLPSAQLVESRFTYYFIIKNQSQNVIVEKKTHVTTPVNITRSRVIRVFIVSGFHQITRTKITLFGYIILKR